jgi:hypothetical protein
MRMEYSIWDLVWRGAQTLKAKFPQKSTSHILEWEPVQQVEWTLVALVYAQLIL